MGVGGLRAGAARADITPNPAEGAWLAGFGVGRSALGVLEPLEATALYLSTDEAEVALVSVDAVGLLRPWIERIRARVREMCGTDIIVCATHTHSGVDTIGLWGPAVLGLFPWRSGMDPAYMEQLISSVADAIHRARAAAVPAQLRTTDVEVDPVWTRNDRQGGGRYDHAVAIALDEASGGERIATALSFASHPEALWEDNRLISPDFPGPFRRHLREHAGGEALYFSGPLGGMLTPNVDKDASPEARQDFVERLGRALGEATLAALPAAEPQSDPTLSHRFERVAFQNTNWRFKLLTRLGFIKTTWTGAEVESEVHYLRLGDLELLSVPGEPVPELGHRLTDRLTSRHRGLLCLASDELGYILEPAMFDDREYRYEATMSLGPETANTLTAACDALLEAS